MKKRAISCQKIRGEDKISDCHDVCSVDKRGCGYHDFVKRWMFCGRRCHYWNTLRSRKRYPKDVLVVYLANSFAKELKKSIWWFLNESMQFHKAPLLYRLILELGPHCPLDVGVEIRNWIVRFVNYGSISCGGLVSLHLGGKVLVEFSFPACLTDLRLLYRIQRWKLSCP